MQISFHQVQLLRLLAQASDVKSIPFVNQIKKASVFSKSRINIFEMSLSGLEMPSQSALAI